MVEFSQTAWLLGCTGCHPLFSGSSPRWLNGVRLPGQWSKERKNQYILSHIE